VTDAVGTGALHQPPIHPEVLGEIAHGVLGGVVNRAVAADAALAGVGEDLLPAHQLGPLEPPDEVEGHYATSSETA
jgi:hypothetical protein